MATDRIIMRGLQKSFGNNAVLRGVDLSVAAGESLCLIGTSGCGKSVTLKCLLGLIPPDSGSILLDGVETVGQSRDAREQMLGRFGMTFQFGALFDSLPIWQNVSFRLGQHPGMTRARCRDRAADILEQLGLQSTILDSFPAELSGGMQKRVALARAIADEPEFLLFDEPTSGLDPITSGTINNLILDAVKRLGATTLTISHDMASVRQIADKVAMIHNGVIIWCGPKSDMDKSGVPEVDQFVHGRADGPLTRPQHASRTAG